jgi:hypothetical protein
MANGVHAAKRVAGEHKLDQEQSPSFRISVGRRAQLLNKVEHALSRLVL